jgi:hypothetical protein
MANMALRGQWSWRRGVYHCTFPHDFYIEIGNVHADYIHTPIYNERVVNRNYAVKMKDFNISSSAEPQFVDTSQYFILWAGPLYRVEFLSQLSTSDTYTRGWYMTCACYFQKTTPVTFITLTWWHNTRLNVHTYGKPVGPHYYNVLKPYNVVDAFLKRCRCIPTTLYQYNGVFLLRKAGGATLL